MYRTMYKCRLCGLVYENGGTETRGYAETDIITKANGHDLLTAVHWCRNGGMGIADFLGFAKDADNKGGNGNAG